MTVYFDWLHFCFVSRRIRRLYAAGACPRCGVWHYVYSPDRDA